MAFIADTDMKSWFNKHSEYTWQPYTQYPKIFDSLPVVSTKGNKLILQDNTELIDGLSSWWSACHGYNNFFITNAIQTQLGIMPHVMFAGLVHEPALKLCSKIIAMLNKVAAQSVSQRTDKDDYHGSVVDLSLPKHNLTNSYKHFVKTFLSDSGSVAVEVALKIAMQFHYNKNKDTKRKIFVYFQNAYHGDTFGAMSVSDNKSNGRIFLHQNHNIMVMVPTNKSELDAFEQVISKHHQQIAGVIIEPLMQGAGGLVFHKPHVLSKIFKTIKAIDKNILFICDECATGFYRTGIDFAFKRAKIWPDIVILGKALSGGFMSIAATSVSKDVFTAFEGGKEKVLMHGPTFMANPLACTAALASLDIFSNFDYVPRVNKIEEVLKDGLESFSGINGVKDVRVLGAVGVLELDSKIFQLNNIQEFISKEYKRLQVWLRPLPANNGNVILYTMPPFTIKKEELKQIITAMQTIVLNSNKTLSI